MRWWAMLILGGYGYACAAGEPESSNPLWGRIRAHMTETLTQLPNYTCLETIDRAEKRRTAKQYHPLDRVRVEVAQVDGRELFGWPGTGEFDERPLGEMLGGATGTGSFSSFTRVVFLSSAPEITYTGVAPLNGRTTHHFVYRVPLLRSGYSLRVPPREGTAGFHGEFWIDQATLDLLRLDIEAEDIPSFLPLREARNTLRYQRVPVGEKDFLLPQEAEMLLVDTDGSHHLNRTRFSGCRQYRGESVLSFEDPAETTAASNVPVKIDLPPGVRLIAKLRDDLQGDIAIGDPVTAVLTNPVRGPDKRELLPKGALLLGRISQFAEYGPDCHQANLSFHAVRVGAARGDLHVELEDVGPMLMVSAQPCRPGMTTIPLGRTRLGLPHSESFYIKGSVPHLPRELRLVFRTVAKDKS